MYLKFPDYYGWAPQDDTEFAMTDDGELYIVFQGDEIDGDKKDIYFTHGFPGAMTEAVRVNDDSYPPYQEYPKIIVEGKDCYILWRNCIDYPKGHSYDYPFIQARSFPHGSEPSPPYDLVYGSISFMTAYIPPNPWNIPLFHFLQGYSEAGSGTPSKRLLSSKVSTFYYPEGPKGNLIPFLKIDSPGIGGVRRYCITESGIVALSSTADATYYSFSPFDFY